MKKLLLFISVFAAINSNAQFLVTDSLNFGEDTTSHGYAKFGNVAVATYTCPVANKSIRIGNGTGGDSIRFNLAVTPNTDSIKLEIVMPWHGGTKLPKVWVANYRSDTVPYMGIGNCIPVYIKMGGLASRTAGGSVKIKLMDTLAGFNMDGQFTYIKIYSKQIAFGINEENEAKNFLNVFPNPNEGIFSIHTNMNNKIPLKIFDALGSLIYINELQDKLNLDLSSFPKGIYLLRAGNVSKRIIIN